MNLWAIFTNPYGTFKTDFFTPKHIAHHIQYHVFSKWLNILPETFVYDDVLFDYLYALACELAEKIEN